MALDDTRREFFKKFPSAQIVDTALQTLDNKNPSFFLATIEEQDIKGAGFTLTRLGEHLEKLLGVQGEVAFFYTSWNDFQHRAYNFMTSRLQQINTKLQENIYNKVRFTPSNRMAFIVGRDPALYERVSEWNLDATSGVTLVPLHVDTDNPEYFRRELVKSAWQTMGRKDLYRTQNPVSGQDFFGRGNLINSLSNGLSRGENFALYGLRRSGKSSVIEELRTRGLSKSEVLAKIDLQNLDEFSIDQMPQIIWEGIISDFRNARESNQEKRITLGSDHDVSGEGMTFALLGSKLSNLAKRNSHIRIIISVDEIEWAVSLAKTEPRKVRSLISSLRTAAQASRNVSLFFTGVANEMFQSSRLGSIADSVDNPIFGQVTPLYLEPFVEKETASLLRDLGAPMFLDWSDEAVHAVHVATGGFPYFVRDLASEVRGQIISAQGTTELNMVTPLVVDQFHVESAIKAWRINGKRDWRELVDALCRHYPEAADLMRVDLKPNELLAWVEEDEEISSACDVLTHLGLLERDASGIRPSGPLEAFTDVRGMPAQTGTHELNKEIANRVLSLIQEGEGHKVEFKSTARIDLATGKKSKDIERSILKTVAAFLNADGGTLLIGVADDGHILGLEKDLASYNNSNNPQTAIDRFERWLLADFLVNRLGGPRISDEVRVTFIKLQGRTVAVVDVNRYGQGVWVDGEEFYVRTGNSTNQYTGAAMVTYLRDREN